MSRIVSRWIPVGVAVVVVAAGAIAMPLAANATASLAPRSAEQVLAMIAGNKVDAFSGTVETTTDLGLPSLPSVPGSSNATDPTDAGVSSLLQLVASPQTARVFIDGKTRERVQVMSSLAEQDVIRNGDDLWQYDSKKNAATHVTLPSRQTTTPTTTPGALANELVARLDSSTATRVGTSTRVAGRSTYTLVLTPKAADTLIGSVSISVDASTGLPLAVSATPRGRHDPAARVAFTSIDLSTPSASLFSFTPPKGAKVTERSEPARPGAGKPVPSEPAEPTVVGTGWDAVIEIAAGGSTSALTGQKTFAELTTAVAGGRVFHTSLANVLITTDGRVLAGSVPVDRLLAVAAGH